MNRELLADQSFFEDDLVVLRITEVGLGLLAGYLIADDFHALPAGEAGRFDREIHLAVVDILAGGGYVVERLEDRTARDIVVLHKSSLKRLVGLDAGLLGAWAKGVDPRGVEFVGHASLQAGFRAHDGECRADVLGVLADRLGVGAVDRFKPLGYLDDTRVPVAGDSVQRTVGRQRAGNRVFAATTANQQYGFAHTRARSRAACKCYFVRSAADSQQRVPSIYCSKGLSSTTVSSRPGPTPIA